MTHLTAVILTYNEAKNIVTCLETLQFADEILVFDSYSTDNTVELAKQLDATIQQRTFDNYANQRNAALNSVKGQTEWVLFVDADEQVSPALANEILEVIQHDKYCGYRIPRHNYIFGKLTKGAGWYPDYQTRLLKSGFAHYDVNRKVHEIVILDCDEGTLSESLIHYNYTSVSQFHEKQRKYTAYDAQILFEQGIRPKPRNYLLQPLRQFWWRFISLQGYQDGWHGLHLSALMTWYEFKKYLQLRKLWK